MPNFNIKQEYMSISIDFVERLVPDANPTFVKIYLYALMLCSSGKECSSEIIAQKLGLLESDVLLAMKYWDEKTNAVSKTTPIPPKPQKQEITVDNVVSDVEESEELRQMLSLAQEVLGKTLTPTDTKTLYWIHSNLNMPIEVILVLLEYCVSINKRNMSYIEQVALSWNERGINTLEDADSFMREQSQREQSYASLKRIFGINSRDLTNIEQNYLKTWTSVYNMSEEMIALAYEYCILRINKLSFPYMDRIIENWFENGIHTIADAEADNENFKNKQDSEKSENFNILKTEESSDEFEKRMWEKMNNEN